ncbi:MAG: hypothetical protein MI975_20220 [Cytophagales bacterium]|nr:hypothetical protein [Cytophagales bacterium]
MKIKYLHSIVVIFVRVRISYCEKERDNKIGDPRSDVVKFVGNRSGIADDRDVWAEQDVGRGYSAGAVLSSMRNGSKNENHSLLTDVCLITKTFEL